MRAAIYTRVSTAEQSTCEQQEALCRDYAERQGWQVVATFSDKQSGLDADRPGWQALLQAARRREFDAVIVYRLDRFGRDPADAFPAIRQLTAHKVELVSASEGDDPLVQRLMLVLAENESRTTSKRVHTFMKGQAQAGYWVSRPPIGYDIAPVGNGRSTLQPNAQAPFVARLFKLAAKGASYRELQRESVAMGLFTKGYLPDRQWVRHILMNPAYAGRVVYAQRARGKFTGKGLRPAEEWVDVPGKHPALVDEAMWAAVEKRLIDARGHSKAGAKTDYLLTSYLFCAHCGGRMQGQKLYRYSRKTGQRTGVVSSFYRCYHGTELKSCEFKYASGPRLDAAVRCEIMRLPRCDLEASTLAALILIEDALGNNGAARAAQIKRLKAQRAQHEKRLINLTRDYYDRKGAARAIPSDVFTALMREAEAAIKVIDSELDAGQEVNTQKLLAAQEILDRPVAEEWPAETNVKAWRKLVEGTVERVDVYSIDDVRVTLKPFARHIVEATERGAALPPAAVEGLIARLDKDMENLRTALAQQERVAAVANTA